MSRPWAKPWPHTLTAATTLLLKLATAGATSVLHWCYIGAKTCSNLPLCAYIDAQKPHTLTAATTLLLKLATAPATLVLHWHYVHTLHWCIGAYKPHTLTAATTLLLKLATAGATLVLQWCYISATLVLKLAQTCHYVHTLVQTEKLATGGAIMALKVIETYH